MKRKGQPCLYCHKVPKPPPAKKIINGECLTVMLSTEDLSSAIADAVEQALYYAERNGDSELIYDREQLIYEAASVVVDNAVRLLDDDEVAKILTILFPDREVVEERSGPEADSPKVLKDKPDRYDMEAAADEVCRDNMDYAPIGGRTLWQTLASLKRRDYRASL
jgi:hypothetical protein